MSAASTTPSEPSLLIAVTGGPGSSKTRLLAELAAHQLALGQRVEGVLALAGERRAPNQGAASYRLRLLGSEQELPWAVRDETLIPPYAFAPETEPILRCWADGLRRQPPAALLLLDEFGKVEAGGRGLMPLWPAFAAAAPNIVAIAVREEHLATIEAAIGRKFDLRVAATAPDALAQLERACADYGEWTRIGLFGGTAGGIEITAGSALHAAKIPFGGLALSSLQGAMMTFAGFGLTQPVRVVWVPLISAGLKALSPAGNRLRPMLAITMQGALYGASVATAGWNLIGVTLGGALIGSWAATQGFLLQYLLLGGELTKTYDAIVLWLAQKWSISAPGLPWLVAAWAGLHALASGGVTLAAWKLRAPPRALRELIERETGCAPAVQSARPKWPRIARDFARWQFWLPLLVVGAIMLATGRSGEAIAWLVLRFVTVAVVMMALVSLLRPARWAGRLRRLGWWGPALAMDAAVARRTPRN